MCTYSSQGCYTGVQFAVTFDYCWLSCKDVLIGQNHKTIDPLWTSFNGMACSLSQRRLRLSSQRDIVTACSFVISARLMSSRNFAYTQSAVCCTACTALYNALL
jgi:hypothetical protein